MCGLTGFIDHCHTSSEAMLQEMTVSLSHRGSDSSGNYFHHTDEAHIGLGHQRLSILDLSALGHQPINYKHLHLIYNGEVYNFASIKQKLIEIDYRFESNSDTEVIIKAFHAWGVECVDKFRGMFAFVIYDTEQQKLFMFRDRAGVKPFYYYVKDGLFLFASELKAFHQHKGFSKVINKDVIPTYMQFGYIPAPYSIFEDTYKLKAGHYIEYNLENANYIIHQYWNVADYYNAVKTNASESEVLEKLEKELTEAFQLRMISDVPVGVFLSGGIDSSVVAALLQKNADKPLKTFTIGFAEEGYNEAGHAKKIAEYLKTDHTEYYCTKEDALEVIPTLATIYDEPFGDSSAIATILVSKLAKEKVSVALSGDGGDEAFCGYSKYFALDKTAKWINAGWQKKVMQITLNCFNEDSIYKLNQLLPQSLKQTNIRDKFQKFKRAINAEDFSTMFINASSYVETSHIERYLLHDGQPLVDTNFDCFACLSDASPLEKMMAIDYQTFMADDVLTKVDRATMSVSLEGREPLLDHKIIEYMAKIPITMKYQNNTGKYLLKKVLYKYVPEDLYLHPKSGFQVPLYEWLKKDLKYLLDKYLAYERLEKGGVFNAEVVHKTLNRYFDGQYINISEIWFILMFEMWRERWDM